MGNNKINYEKIGTKSSELGSVLGMSLKKQKAHYNKLIRKLPKGAVKDQALQILNYKDNIHDGDLPVTTLYENCSIVLKQHIEADKLINSKDCKEFKKSLDNSQDCIANPSLYIKKITELEDGNNKSFILAPICATTHIFSTVIYKKNDMYEFIVINKGARESSSQDRLHYIFERYEIPMKNLDDVVKNLSRYSDDDNLKTVGRIYDVFEQSTYSNTYDELEDIGAREQRAGNCYYKAIEEGLKYAYSEAFNGYEIFRYKIDNEVKEEKVPKLPGGIQNFQNELLDNIKKGYNDKETTMYIDKITSVYNKNKEFRKRMYEEIRPDLDSKKKIFYKIFGDNEQKTNDIDYLKECLKHVDERTLQEQIDFFIELLKEKDIKMPMSMYYASDNNYAFTDFLECFGTYKIYTEQYVKELAFMEEYFPMVDYRIKENINKEDIDKILDHALKMMSKHYNYDLAEKLLNIALAENFSLIDKANMYKLLGLSRESQGYSAEAAMLYKRGYDIVNNVNFIVGERCKSLYNKVVDNINKSKEELQSTNKKLQKPKHKDDIFLLHEKARLERATGDLKGAIKTIETCEKQFDVTNLQDRQSKIIALKDKADIYNHLGNFRRSNKIYKEALELYTVYDENDAVMLEIKGDILKNMQKEEKASLAYERAMEILVKSNGHPDDYDRIDAKEQGISLYKSVGIALEETLNQKEVLSPKIDNEKNIQEYTESLMNGYSKDNFNELIKILRTENRNDEILDLIDNKLPINTCSERDYLKVRISRFRCLKDMGRKQEALDESEYILFYNSAKFENTDVQDRIVAERAKIMQDLGYNKQALGEYTIMLRNYPHNRSFRKNVQRLTNMLRNKTEGKRKKYIYKSYTLNIPKQVEDDYKADLYSYYRYSDKQIEVSSGLKKHKEKLENITPSKNKDKIKEI